MSTQLTALLPNSQERSLQNQLTHDLSRSKLINRYAELGLRNPSNFRSHRYLNPAVTILHQLYQRLIALPTGHDLITTLSYLCDLMHAFVSIHEVQPSDLLFDLAGIARKLRPRDLFLGAPAMVNPACALRAYAPSET